MRDDQGGARPVNPPQLRATSSQALVTQELLRALGIDLTCVTRVVVTFEVGQPVRAEVTRLLPVSAALVSRVETLQLHAAADGPESGEVAARVISQVAAACSGGIGETMGGSLIGNRDAANTARSGGCV